MRLSLVVFDTGGPTPQATPGEAMKSYVQRSITQELQKRMGKTRNIVVSEELFRKDRSDGPSYSTNEGLSKLLKFTFQASSECGFGRHVPNPDTLSGQDF